MTKYVLANVDIPIKINEDGKIESLHSYAQSGPPADGKLSDMPMEHIEQLLREANPGRVKLQQVGDFQRLHVYQK